MIFPRSFSDRPRWASEVHYAQRPLSVPLRQRSPARLDVLRPGN
jgi:hypothetical protein